MNRVSKTSLSVLCLAIIVFSIAPITYAYQEPPATYEWGPAVPNYNPSAAIHPGTIDTSGLVFGDFVGVSPTEPYADTYGDSGPVVGWDDVAGALFVALYILIARYQRENIQLIPYLIAVYGFAALSLLILIFLFGYPLFQYSIKIHIMMILLAVIPTGVGHSLINWAARKMEIYKVNFSILGEPIIASILAYIIFNEKPYGYFYLGAGLIILGIVLALLDRSQKFSD